MGVERECKRMRMRGGTAVASGTILRAASLPNVLKSDELQRNNVAEATKTRISMTCVYV